MIDSSKIKNILIIQTAYLGDVILTLPLIQFLKNKLPNTTVSLLSIPELSEILNPNPLIDEIIYYDKRKNRKFSYLFEIIKLIKSKKYDLIISPHRSFRSTFISTFSGVKNRITFNNSSLSFLYNYIVRYNKNKHEILRNLDLLKPLDFNSEEIIKPKLYISKEKEKKIDEYVKINQIPEKFITIAPGSVWFTKQFPKEKFVNLINGLNENIYVVLIGGEKDMETGDFIKTRVSNRKIHNAIGKLSIPESAELIRRSQMLIANDSAPLHLANAVETNVAAIFGSTIPNFGFYPIGKNDAIFEIKNLYCRPCGIHGHKECPEKHFRCMLDINEQEISKYVNSKILN
ncbi:MAG TPA: glycosyltransferase family 9 protein [Ignavibacteria bacterium]|nr:glycosyltransferase family 9 protein [Ignavibacteria bacterium]